MSDRRGECNVCKTLSTKQCVRCKKVFYCGEQHQREDWKNHKQFCKQMEQRNQGNAAPSSYQNNISAVEKSPQGFQNQAYPQQRQELNSQNPGISGNNAINQVLNNVIQQNQQMKNQNANQMSSPAQNQNYNQGIPQTNRSLNNTISMENQGNQLNTAVHQSNMINSPMNTPMQSQNSQMNNTTSYYNEGYKQYNNQIQNQNQKIDRKLKKEKDMKYQELTSIRMKLRSEVVKLLAKFKYNEASEHVKLLCQKSEEIYKKEMDIDELYELLADELLQVKIMIKTKTNNDNKLAVQNLQGIFQRIAKIDDYNELKKLNQIAQQNEGPNKKQTDINEKNNAMNEIRKRCNLISLVANLFYSLGYYKDCEEAYVRYVKLIENFFGQDALETSNCYFLMGVYYLQHRYYVKALACFKRSMSIRSQKLTERHESVTDCMYNIGIAYKQMQKKQKAQDQLEKTLFYRRSVIGESSLPVAQTLEILGKIYMESGNSDFSIALNKFQECYAIRKSIIQNNKHPDMVRISLLIVHLYNLIKSQQAQLEASQPTKQTQQLKEIEQEMLKNVIDGNIQHYFQTQKNNPERFQELQNQHGIQIIDISTGNQNQFNINANKIQNIMVNSQTAIIDNNADELMKAQQLGNNSLNNLQSSTGSQPQVNSLNPTYNQNKYKEVFANPRASFNYSQSQQQQQQQRDRAGSQQSKDSISPNKNTYDQEENYSPVRRNNQSKSSSKYKKQVYEEISEDENFSEDEGDRASKKFSIQMRKTVLSSLTWQQMEELIKLNENINIELKRDPQFNPRDMIVNSLFISNVKEMNFREICQDLIQQNPEIFKPDDFGDQRYFNNNGGNEVNNFTGFGNGPSPFEKRIQFQEPQQMSQQNMYEQQNNFGQQNSFKQLSAFGQQNSFGYQNSFNNNDQPKQGSKYDMDSNFSFPPQQQQKSEFSTFKPLKQQDQYTPMQMNTDVDPLAILNQGNYKNRQPNMDQDANFGPGNNDYQNQQYNQKFQNNEMPQIKFQNQQNDGGEDKISKVKQEEMGLSFLKGMMGKQQKK